MVTAGALFCLMATLRLLLLKGALSRSAATRKERENMPQIIVTADRGEGTVTWRERINASDFESTHFAQQLVERIGWAVSDAHEVEQDEDRRPLTTQDAEPAPVPAGS
jgi:hypothetical protein